MSIFLKKVVRRCPYSSDTTWTLRQQRLWLRRKAHAASSSLACWELGTAFAALAWRFSQSWLACCWHGISDLFTSIAQLMHAVKELKHIQPFFLRSLRLDQRRFISEAANLAATSCAKVVVTLLRPLLGPPRRKQRGPAPLPALELENGELASTRDEADARWLRRFSAAEQGGPISPECLIRRCFNKQSSVDLELLDVAKEDLATRCDLEAALRAARPGRAAGNDSLSPDILHHFAGSLPPLLYPILLKIAFRQQEPLQFKGGTVHHIRKQKGPLEQCSSDRGILVSNKNGRSIHSAFRTICGQWFDAAATPLQVGGRRGFPVQLAAQAVREFQSGHRKKGKCAAVIFLDLREAFHTVARPPVHGGDLSDEHISSVIRALARLPP